MKKCNLEKLTVAICAVLVLLLVVAGCGTSSADTPSTVVRKFLKAMIAHDSAGSYSLLSKKFKGDYGVTAMTWDPYATSRNFIPTDATFTIKGENVTGDTATVTVLNRNGQESQVRVVRETGKWLVDHDLGEWYGLAE